MFFLLRMAFWLGLVCVLLPSGGAKTNPQAQIDAGQAVTLASAAVTDARGFCERQPTACQVGGKVAVALGYKAEAGARRIYDFVSTKVNGQAEPKAAAQPAGKVETTASIDHGTLKASDLAPAVRVKVPLPPRRQGPRHSV